MSLVSLGLVMLCGEAQAQEQVAAKGADKVIHAVVQLVHTSPIPDAKKSDYEDCLFSAEAKVLEITGEPRAPREIALLLPAFLKRVIQPEAAFKAGQVIEVAMIPSEYADKRYREMQRADDMERFDLDVCFAQRATLSARKVEDFPAQPDTYFATKPADMPRAAAPVIYPSSPKAAEERQKAIEREKAMIRQALADNGDDWHKWELKVRPMSVELRDRAKASPDRCLVKGPLLFERIRDSYFKQLLEEPPPAGTGPIASLISMNRQLRERGIDLIVVPFPWKEDVHAEEFSDLAPKDGWLLPYREKFMLQLLEADIEVVELIPALRAARQRFPWVFYDARDQHPADGGIQVAAEEIAKRVSRYDLTPQGGSAPLKLELRPAEITKEGFRGMSQYPATRVFKSDGEPLDIEADTGSPILIIGDSYTVMPAYYKPGGSNAGISFHLAQRLGGVVPDQLSRMGTTGNIMKMLAEQGGSFLAGRRVVVFIFSPNRLFNAEYVNGTDSWKPIELPPLQGAK